MIFKLADDLIAATRNKVEELLRKGMLKASLEDNYSHLTIIINKSGKLADNQKVLAILTFKNLGIKDEDIPDNLKGLNIVITAESLL